MTPFGAPAQQQADTGGGGGDRFEERNVVIVQGDEKKTGSGKVYWRVKDSSNKWYSVWEPATKIRLETAADNAEAVRVAVKISPGNDPNRPFYTIIATDNAVDAALAEGKTRATQADQPGGRGSQFGKRMHPDDALRVTNLAVIERALHMAELTLVDKPDEMKNEQWVKGKMLEYMQFLNGLLKMPNTPTPATPPGTPVGDDPGPDPTDPGVDDDIPF